MGEQMNSKTNKTPNLNKTVLTYGLSEKQLEIVIKNLPTEDIKVYDVSGCFTDLIAIGNIATIINPAVLEAEDIDDFNQLNEEFFFTYEKVVFVADHPVLELLSSNSIQRVVNQRRLPRTGNPSHDRHNPLRDFKSHIL